MAIKVELAKSLNFGFLDTLEIEPIGLVRLIGWSESIEIDQDAIKLYLGSAEQEPINRFFLSRPDLPTIQRFDGFCIEYYLPKNFAPGDLRLQILGEEIWHMPLRPDFISPHYENLLFGASVPDRDGIYGFGPPSPTIDPAILDLICDVPGRVLDFGCGSGALVRHLRARGIDAYGIEIDRPAIRDAIGDDIRSRITLYHGAFPMPFAGNSFDTVIATEVLEHIPDFRAALGEIARVCATTFIATVPDMSAIPLCFPHAVVPWHLMEGTHVNFFNQTSLAHELDAYFSRSRFGRINERQVNGSTFYTNLVARCHK